MLYAVKLSGPYYVNKTCLMPFVSKQESFSPPEVVNRDDDQQVQDHSE